MNRFVSKAARTARNPEITTEAKFWDAVGRPDLATVPDHHLFCTYLEGLHIARRAIAKRAGAVPPARKRPITDFIFVPKDETGARSWPGRIWNLRPTKGWRANSVNQIEAEYARKHGVPITSKWPLTESRRAT